MFDSLTKPSVFNIMTMKPAVKTKCLLIKLIIVAKMQLYFILPS